MTFSSGVNGARTRWDQAASTLLEVSIAFIDNISQVSSFNKDKVFFI